MFESYTSWNQFNLVGRDFYSIIALTLYKTIRSIENREKLGFSKHCGKWLIEWCLMLSSTVFQLYHGDQCTYPCFPEFFWPVLHNILSKPLAAFPHNHCRNNGQRWEEWILLQWPSSIFGKNIGQAGDRTRDLLFSRLQCYQLSYGARLAEIWFIYFITINLKAFLIRFLYSMLSWPWGKGLLKTMWMKEKMLANILVFPLSHNVFYPIKDKFCHFIHS